MHAAGPTLVCVESLAESFDVPVEVVLVKDLIQAGVERMGGAAWQILGRDPHRRPLRVPLSFAHRHRRQCGTQAQSCRSKISTSESGGRNDVVEG